MHLVSGLILLALDFHRVAQACAGEMLRKCLLMMRQKINSNSPSVQAWWYIVLLRRLRCAFLLGAFVSLMHVETKFFPMFASRLVAYIREHADTDLFITPSFSISVIMHHAISNPAVCLCVWIAAYVVTAK